MTNMTDEIWKDLINKTFKEYKGIYGDDKPYAYVTMYNKIEKEDLLDYLKRNKKLFTKIDFEGIEEIDDNVYKIYLEREKW